MASTQRPIHPIRRIVMKKIPPPDLHPSNELAMEEPPIQAESKPEPPQKKKRAAPTKAQGAAKKKKPNPPSKPVKGGWVLPHGMSLALGAITPNEASEETAGDDNNEANSVDEVADLSTAQTTAEGLGSQLPITPSIEELEEVTEEAAVVDDDKTVESAVGRRATRSSTRSTQVTATASSGPKTLIGDEDTVMEDAEEAVVVKSNAKPAKAKAAKPRAAKSSKPRTKAVKPAVEESTALEQANEADINMGVQELDNVVDKGAEATVATRRSSRAAAASAKEAMSKAKDADTPMPDADEQDVSEPDTKKPAKRGPRKSTKTADGEKKEKAEIPLLDQKMKVKRGTTNKYGLTRGTTPYPNRTNLPTKEQCYEVHDILTEMHGEVTQPTAPLVASLDVAGCGEVPSVLDALLRTLISGNTLMANADMAVKSLVKTYGILKEGIGAGSIDWNAVRLGTLDKLATTIRAAGCPRVKGGHIKAILDMVFEEQKVRAQAHLEGEAVPGAEKEDDGQKALEVQKVSEGYLSLDHMYSMTADEAITEFVRYPGIGVKTAACVVLFCLRIPCFAVDTHVHKFCVWLGWVPEKANELDTFNHGEFTVPDPLKYGLHQLFIRHGQRCFKCRKNTKPGTKAWEEADDCPLEHLLDRSKGNFGRADKGDEGEVKLEEAIEGQTGIAETAAKVAKKRAPRGKKVKSEEVDDAGDDELEGSDAEKTKKAAVKKRAPRAKKAKEGDVEDVENSNDNAQDEKVEENDKGSNKKSPVAAKKKPAPKRKAATPKVDKNTEQHDEAGGTEDGAVVPTEEEDQTSAAAKKTTVTQKKTATKKKAPASKAKKANKDVETAEEQVELEDAAADGSTPEVAAENKEAVAKAEPGRYGLRRRS